MPPDAKTGGSFTSSVMARKGSPPVAWYPGGITIDCATVSKL